MRGIRLYGLALLLAGLGSAAQAQAQTNADSALLAVVQQAFEQTTAASSLHVEMQRLTDMGDGQQGQRETASYDAVRAGESWNISGARTATFTLPTGTIETTTEMVILDGTVYLRTERSGAEMPQLQGQQPQGQPMPDGWYEASMAAPNENGDRPGARTAQAAQALEALLLPVDTASVSAISELTPDTLNDQAMRVFQIKLDPTALRDSGMFGLMGGGFGGFGDFRVGGPASFQGQPQPPAEGAAPPNDQMQLLESAAIQMTFAVYVGQDDGFVHRIYSVAVVSTANAEAPQPALKLTTVTDFSAFNAPVTITTPVIGS